MKSSPYLLVKHSTGWNVDRCCRWMDQYQQPYQWCYPADGDTFPPPESYAGIIVFGGAGSANDDTQHDWVRNELAFIETALRAEIPFFGICLGAQMLARVLGSKVYVHPASIKEVGFHKITPTKDAGDFLTEPLDVMQWHSEGFDLPPDCQLLAQGEEFPNQAFRYGETAYGVQFHPEVNPDALAIWQERNRKRRPGQLNDADRARQMQDAIRYDKCNTQWLDQFLKGWTHMGNNDG
ncbi:MAG: gamma-glutamyl-gamma-aminobutyrate hydrolase family protein [Granulosicoccus sp.]|nr:gamma-glutamyl-gamma-aminobutyrate hydrolase family protein [Granulosicoccus sp.]